MEKIGYGVIGIGSMGRMHIGNLKNRIPNAEVVALCHYNEDKLKKAQEELEVAKGYTSYDAMLQDPEVDAVVIATGASMHKEHVLKACEAGKHIFCEKPLAKTLEDCRAIEAAVENNAGKMFTVGFMRRFDPTYMEAKKKIKAGEIGQVIHVKCTSLDPASVLDDHLEGVKKGIYAPWFIEMGSHDTDLARWLLEGEPQEIFATGGAYVCSELADYDDYDNGFSLTMFDNGTSAAIHVGRTHTCSHVATEIIGTKGTLTVNAIPRKSFLGQYTEAGYLEACQDDFLYRWGQSYVNELDDFTRCILEERRPETTAKDGTASLAYSLRLHEAYLKSGR